jgi:hypothetical protein
LLPLFSLRNTLVLSPSHTDIQFLEQGLSWRGDPRCLGTVRQPLWKSVGLVTGLWLRKKVRTRGRPGTSCESTRLWSPVTVCLRKPWLPANKEGHQWLKRWV